MDEAQRHAPKDALSITGTRQHEVARGDRLGPNLGDQDRSASRIWLTHAVLDCVIGPSAPWIAVVVAVAIGVSSIGIVAAAVIPRTFAIVAWSIIIAAVSRPVRRDAAVAVVVPPRSAALSRMARISA